MSVALPRRGGVVVVLAGLTGNLLSSVGSPRPHPHTQSSRDWLDRISGVGTRGLKAMDFFCEHISCPFVVVAIEIRLYMAGERGGGAESDR